MPMPTANAPTVTPYRLCSWVKIADCIGVPPRPPNVLRPGDAGPAVVEQRALPRLLAPGVVARRTSCPRGSRSRSRPGEPFAGACASSHARASARNAASSGGVVEVHDRQIRTGSNPPRPVRSWRRRGQCETRPRAMERCMERLTGLDATFLYLETPTHHMHVAVTMVHRPGRPCRAATRSRRSRTSSAPASTWCRRSGAGSWRCRSACTTRSGSRTRTSTSTTTSAASGAPAPGGRRELGEVAGQIASTPARPHPAAVGAVGGRGAQARTASASSPRSTTPPSTAPPAPS